MVRIPKRIPQRGADPQADLGTALAARYPEWFALGRVASLPGWAALIEQLFADLDRTLTKAARAQLQIAAVRERDGRLQVETYVEVPAARPLIDQAAVASTRICQSCGAPGRRKVFAGWAATLCAACRRRWGAMRIGPA